MLNLLRKSNSIQSLFADINKDTDSKRVYAEISKDKSIVKYQHENNISFFLLEFKPMEILNCNINISDYELTSEKPSVLMLENVKSKYHTALFLPSNLNTTIKNNTLHIKGIIVKSGHKVFFCFNSKHAIDAIDPLLANNNYYPYNNICGFKISCGSYRYVVFIHLLDALDDLDGKTINANMSVFEFLNDDLVSVSYVKGSEVKHFGI